MTLLKAVPRAHRWFAKVSPGTTPSRACIVAREGIAVRYVSRLIRLAFLAPDITESIVVGRQPSDTTAEGLTRHRASHRMAFVRNVGTLALRNAMLLNVSSVSFAAALQDQDVKKLDVGDVAGAVVTGAILAYDTDKRLQERELLPRHSIDVGV